MHHLARPLLFAIALAPIPLGSAMPQTAPSLDVDLIRQDFSDCTNSNVTSKDPSLIGGSAVLVREPNGTTQIKVGITAKPDTTYHFFLKCVRQLGDITTGDEGAGTGAFEFATNSTGNIYAFDMYPEGAPPGNRYQSVQVKF
jgi:hypothetical protein